MEWHNRSVYVFAKTETGSAEKVWKNVQNWKETIGSWVVTGDWDVVAWFDAYSWDDAYQLATKLRKEKGVTASSSHWVNKGWKNGSWWWDYPQGVWVLWRDYNLNGNWKKTTNWKWAVSSASIPGDWDWLSWVGGKNWDETWNNLMTFQKAGWETKTMVPVRSWWNKKWTKSW